MSAEAEDAAQMVARALGRRKAADRPAFLRELLAHTAAGLVVRSTGWPTRWWPAAGAETKQSDPR